jgi:hypothetical protein
MTRDEAERYLKDTYQLAPTGGGMWIETSDIEEAIDEAALFGRARLADHVVTWQEGAGYAISGA